ncbi:MAG TPA: hypothetical protein VGL93_03355 [Streptosporangiaceae bacterium]|jgi:hypothetical protein
MRVWTAVATGVIFAIATGGPANQTGKSAAHDPADPPEHARPVANLKPADLVTQVTSATQRARFSRFSITMRPRNGGSPHADVSGVYRFTRPYGADVSATITAPGRDGTDQRTRFVASGRYLYFKPPGGAGLPSGKAWVRFARDDDVGATRYVRPLVLEIARALDAVRDWRMFAAAAKLHKAGTITDGTRMRGYNAAVNVPRALRGTTDGTHAMLVDIANRGIDRIGYTVWLDDRTKLPGQAQVGMVYKGRAVDVRADYTAWGKAVTIPVPPGTAVVRHSGG